MTWYDKLKSLRGNKTIEEVTNATDISPNTYEAYERGDRMPLDPVKVIIAKYFKVTVEDIWGE
jgi:DNA-binding XRE family transcriptional regulator